MARYSVGATTSAGSTTLPIISLYAGATGAPRLIGLRVFNTTTTAVEFELVRLTTTGTQGTALTEAPWRDRASANVAQAFNTHSVAPTVGTRLGIFYSLGAAIGSGVMDTFDDGGIVVPTGTSNGLGLLTMGTGQVCRATMIFEDD
jgi:hypothetical protein